MSDGTLHIPDQAPTRKELELSLAVAKAKVDDIIAGIEALDRMEADEAEAAQATPTCPAISEVMKRLDDIEEAIRNITVIYYPQTITSPGTNPVSPKPYTPYVPWWEINKIWCSNGDVPTPQFHVKAGTVAYVGIQPEGAQ